MDGVKLVLKAQVASDAIIAHVARAKAVLAETECRKNGEEEWLLGVHDVQGKLKEARKELAAALRIMRRTVWPKGGRAMPTCAGGRTSSVLTVLRGRGKGHAMDARERDWHGGSGQNLPMPVLRELATNEIRRLTRSAWPLHRQLLLLAMNGFMRWCILARGITDGHDITPAIAKEFRVMLRRSGVKRRVWELHRDAVAIVLGIIATNIGVCHADPGEYLLYTPTAGEIWEHPEREFGLLYPDNAQ